MLDLAQEQIFASCTLLLFTLGDEMQKEFGIHGNIVIQSYRSLSIHGGPLGVGNLAAGIVGFDGVLSQGVQGEPLAEILNMLSAPYYLKKFSCRQRSNMW
jgi:hypothetical protein